MNNYKKEMFRNKIKEIFIFFIFIIMVGLTATLLYFALKFTPKPYTFEERQQQIHQWG